MIKSLHIKNYALIEELQMEPSDRLNIITGETGAGKSIMLGAVGLLLGNRADSKVLLNEAGKCVVEGTFDLSGYKLESIFKEEDLDFEQESVIRREINAAGKSRAFINDTPTTLAVLKRIGQYLMEVHSQHESLQLGDNKYQQKVLDTFAGHDDLRQQYQLAFTNFSAARSRLSKLETQSEKSAEDLDYKQFLFEELDKANLDSLNQATMEQELEVLENAEEIKQKLAEASYHLDESEASILQQLKEVQQSLSSVESFSGTIESLNSRLKSATIELQDVWSDLQQQQDLIEHDPAKINELRTSLDELLRLQKKHTCNSVEELISLRNDLNDELSSVVDLDQTIEETKKELAKTEKSVKEAGAKLTESRKLFALNLADEIEKIIQSIGIENGSIEIAINPTEPREDGMDNIDMFFSANKGVKPQELKEVASGGEFSRLIFAIKYLIADKTALPTIIFDEIDTGVSGQVALQMIQMMKKMAENHQVISISHLPQFAAGGDAHYFVYKDHTSSRSVSRIRRLEKDDRIMEIAKMIGGENPANAAIESAKELLAH